MLAVTLPRGGLDPWGRGRLPQRRDKAAAALRDPERRMETRVGRSARKPGAGSFRGGQEAGVAARPPGERKGRRNRGRVPLSASQRLRQGGLPGADGISARRLGKAWLLHCFRRTELGVGKATKLSISRSILQPIVLRTARASFCRCSASPEHSSVPGCLRFSFISYLLLPILTTVAVSGELSKMQI